MASAATSRTLNYQFQFQQTGYWCGPAATRIALSARGRVFTQAYLAGQLHTTVNGTNSAAETTRVLNNLGNTRFYETKWIPGNTATQAQINRLQWDVVFDIDRGYPLVANVVGRAIDTDGDAHAYMNGHYLAIVGYSSDGWNVKVADSADAHHVGWYWMSTSRMATWIAARGYSA
jgi:Peptidase_C39 like family